MWKFLLRSHGRLREWHITSVHSSSKGFINHESFIRFPGALPGPFDRKRRCSLGVRSSTPTDEATADNSSSRAERPLRSPTSECRPGPGYTGPGAINFGNYRGGPQPINVGPGSNYANVQEPAVSQCACDWAFCVFPSVGKVQASRTKNFSAYFSHLRSQKNACPSEFSDERR